MATTNNRVFKTNSGEEIPITPVSEIDLTPFIGQITDFTRPPTEIVDGKVLTNEADKAYQDSLSVKNLQKGTFMMAVLFELGIDKELNEVEQAAVDRTKRKLEKVNPGAPENQFDLFIYAKSVCPSMEELTRLMAAIQALNNPTAQQVQNVVDTFRPHVQGSTGYGDKDAPKWVGVPDWQPETTEIQSGYLGGDTHTGLLRPIGPRMAG